MLLILINKSYWAHLYSLIFTPTAKMHWNPLGEIYDYEDKLEVPKLSGEFDKIPNGEDQEEESVSLGDDMVPVEKSKSPSRSRNKNQTLADHKTTGKTKGNEMFKTDDNYEYINRLKQWRDSNTDSGLQGFMPGEIVRYQDENISLFRNTNSRESKLSMAQIMSKIHRGSGASNFTQDNDLNFLSTINGTNSNQNPKHPNSLKRKPKRYFSVSKKKVLNTKSNSRADSLVTPPRSKTKEDSNSTSQQRSENKKLKTSFYIDDDEKDSDQAEKKGFQKDEILDYSPSSNLMKFELFNTTHKPKLEGLNMQHINLDKHLNHKVEEHKLNNYFDTFRKDINLKSPFEEDKIGLFEEDEKGTHNYQNRWSDDENSNNGWENNDEEEDDESFDKSYEKGSSGMINKIRKKYGTLAFSAWKEDPELEKSCSYEMSSSPHTNFKTNNY